MKKIAKGGIKILGIGLLSVLMCFGLYYSTSGFSMITENWTINKIYDNSGSSAVSGGVALDFYNGIPHIASIDDISGDGNYGLNYSYDATTGGNCDDGTWQGDTSTFECENLTTSANGGDESNRKVDIKVASNGRHVVYSNGTNLVYTTCSSGCDNSANWTSDTIDTNGSYGKIALNTSNNPSVVYKNTSTNDLMIADYVGGGGGSGCSDTDWTCTTIEGTDTVANNPDIIIDSSNNKYIIFGNTTDTDTFVATDTAGTGCSNSSWTCTVIDSNFASDGSSIALESDLPRVAYHDGPTNDIYYLEYSGGSWSTPDKIADYGDIPSLSIDTGTNIEHISWALISGTSALFVAENVDPYALENSPNIMPTAHAFTAAGAGCDNPPVNGSANWTCHWAYNETNPTIGHTSIHLSVPKVAYGTEEGLFYTEQDLEEGTAIPELPKSNLWKILIAVLALGIVVGIVAWKKKGAVKPKS